MADRSEWNHQMIKTADNCLIYSGTIGDGTPLLLIHGAAVDSEFFADFAKIMASYFQVITFDRRGYGRSTTRSYPQDMTGEQYYSLQAEDAYTVLKAYTDKPAVVLGCSAGALTAMYLAKKHTECISKLYLHEPPAYSLMKDNTQVWDMINRIKECINAGKYNSAINRFIQFVTSSRQSKKEMTEYEIDTFMDNCMNYIKNEYRLTFSDNTVPESLPEELDIMVMVGSETGAAPLGVAALRIAEKFGLDTIEMPGSHNGVRDDSEDFAKCFLRLPEMQSEKHE